MKTEMEIFSAYKPSSELQNSRLQMAESNGGMVQLIDD